MKFTIEHGPVYASLRVDMQQGEQFRAEPGAMLAMTPTIELETKSSGKGLFGTLKAAVGGESIFAALYTANSGPGELHLAPSAPGDIIRIDLNHQTLLAFGGAYLAGSSDLQISSRGSLKGFVSGTDLFLSVITGTGSVFLNGFGAIQKKELSAGESFIVDTGHIVAFTDGVQYSIKKAAKGLLSSLTSGEGLVCLFSGPGTIWIQNRNMQSFAQSLLQFMPTKG